MPPIPWVEINARIRIKGHSGWEGYYESKAHLGHWREQWDIAFLGVSLDNFEDMWNDRDSAMSRALAHFGKYDAEHKNTCYLRLAVLRAKGRDGADFVDPKDDGLTS